MVPAQDSGCLSKLKAQFTTSKSSLFVILNCVWNAHQAFMDWTCLIYVIYCTNLLNFNNYNQRHKLLRQSQMQRM